jgi:hypothetical protein
MTADESIEDAFAGAKLESTKDWIVRKLKGAGFHVTQIHRVRPPTRDCRETEVLFRGRERGTTGKPQPFAAYIPDDPNGKVEVEEGW